MWPDKKSNKESVKQPSLETLWILHIDGASNFKENRAGLILSNSKGVVIKYALWFSLKASNI